MSNDRGWARARLHALREAGFGGVRVSNDRGWIRKMAEAEGECASVAAGSLFPQLEREETPAPAKPGSVSFVVLGIPKAQGRARAFVMPGTRQVRMYDPADSKSWKQEVRHAASEAAKGNVLPGPLRLICAFYLPRPGRLVWKTRPMPSEPCDRKPDLDNLVKAVKDALKGCVWKDDSQVTQILAEKKYAAGPGYGDERARVEVTVQEVK